MRAFASSLLFEFGRWLFLFPLSLHPAQLILTQVQSHPQHGLSLVAVLGSAVCGGDGIFILEGWLESQVSSLNMKHVTLLLGV